MWGFFCCVLVALAGFFGAAPAHAQSIVEPRRITSPDELREGEGALLLSIRHQTPILKTMHVRFVSADDPSRRIKFERKAPVVGTNGLLDRKVEVYAVPAGRWMIESHLVGCDADLQPGQQCFLEIMSKRYPMPSGVYQPGWFSFDVPERGFVVAEELMLEFPLGTELGIKLPEESYLERTRMLRFKSRKLPETDTSMARPFAGLQGGKIVVADEARSAVQCDRPANKRTFSYIPFSC
jgi:hypothetical protein